MQWIPHLEMRRKTGLFLSCGRALSGVPLSGDGYVREHLELPQGYQGIFEGSRGEGGILSRRCCGKGPHLALRGESSVFLECGRKLGVSQRVATGGMRGPGHCCLRKIKFPCEL